MFLSGPRGHSGRRARRHLSGRRFEGDQPECGFRIWCTRGKRWGPRSEFSIWKRLGRGGYGGYLRFPAISAYSADMRCAIYFVPLALAFTVCSSAQTEGLPSDSKGTVELTHLLEPTYPMLAREARISGDVEVQLGIRRNGSVDSAAVVNGHPMLAPAALKSARESTFECRECSQDLTPYTLTYSFEFPETTGPDWPCPAGNGVHVTLAQNRVTVASEPTLVHPYFSFFPARSAKCAYLWRCGERWGGTDWYYYRARSLKCLDLWNCGYRLREPFATCKRLHRRILP